jgi:integrase
MTLREMTAAEHRNRKSETAGSEKSAGKGITLAEYGEKYLAYLRASRTSHAVEMAVYGLRIWLRPLAEMPLATISTADLERLVVAPMLEAGRSPASIELYLGLFSAMWNRAKDEGLVEGMNPKSKARRPKADNRRDRFLTPSEAVRLLAALKERSVTSHDVALLSLFSGLRLRECLRLTWADVDFEHGIIFVKDTKNKHNRHAYMTDEIRDMLTRRYRDRPAASRKVFLWPRNGESACLIDAHYREAVQKLGLNDGIEDRRQILVFHSLRHTFASWLVQKGQPLYTVGKLMGHKRIEHTERYAHLAPKDQLAATLQLEGFLDSPVNENERK